VIAFKRPSGSWVKRLMERALEKQKPNSSIRLCIALTQNNQTGMQQVRDLYIYMYVCTKYREFEHAGHQL